MIDIPSFLLGKAMSSGGSSVTVESLSVTENGTYTAEEGKAYSPVTVSVGGVDQEADVRFFDSYDGTVVASYSAADFANLTELPANPTHDGLTSQGWNWTLSDAKTQVAWSKKLDIGQQYVPTDGATKVYVHLVAPALSPTVKIGVKGGTVTVDWGDSTTPSTDSNTGTSFSEKTFTHTYAAAGDYVVSISVSEGGEYQVAGNSSGYGSYLFTNNGSNSDTNYGYNSCIRRIAIGESVTIDAGAFAGTVNADFVTFPTDTVFLTSKSYWLRFAGVKFVSFPSGVTDIGSSAFQSCVRLFAVSLPLTVTTIKDYSFSGCYSLKRFVSPKNVSSIQTNALQSCYGLSFLSFPSAISSTPTGLTASGSSLTEIEFPANVTSIGSYACYDAYNLRSIKFLGNVTVISDKAFQNCHGVQFVDLPSTLTQIGAYTFYCCYALTKIEIPATVTSLGNYCFSSCKGLQEIRFKGSTPPTVGAAAFGSIPTSCKIYVPSGSLSAYTGTSNMPSSSSYTYIEY